MSRRSSRLVSGGYYNSDEESDSSSVTNISYRENPVKVFKKKAGKKAASRTSSRANSNASSPSADTPVTEGQPESSPELPVSVHHEDRTLRLLHSHPSAGPDSVIGPESDAHVLPLCASREGPVHPVHCPYGSSRPGLHLRPNHKELSQSGVDSSGYSSSEGTYRKPAAATSSDKMSSNNGAPSPGYGSRISSAFVSLKDSASSMAVAAESKAMTALGVWLLLPLLTSFFSRMSVAKSQTTQTKPKIQPVVPVPAPPPPAQPSTVHHTPVVDPAVVSAAVETNMKRVLAELQQQQDQLFAQVQERVKQDVQSVKARLEVMDSESRLRLEQEVAGLGRQMEDYQSDSRSSAAALILRIQALEAQNAQLVQELSSIQLMPPPAPGPDPSAVPVQTQLTPELQQAMEKWLSDRIKEHDALRLSDRGGVTDSGRPVADKMADFALETQGASVISTRCSETYRIRSACVTLFGFPLWYPSESPRTVIQGYPVLLPGKCWAFHGVQGTLGPSDEVYRVVELRVLSNWGHVKYTCLYRFRVHGKMADT
ncbi:hypothetical protein INR49_028786 [Caranx melampygus]|nr:hypothetical protein INR49_028786 [Caranx melampygus]